jgi:hypothetical protein
MSLKLHASNSQVSPHLQNTRFWLFDDPDHRSLRSRRPATGFSRHSGQDVLCQATRPISKRCRLNGNRACWCTRIDSPLVLTPSPLCVQQTKAGPCRTLHRSLRADDKTCRGPEHCSGQPHLHLSDDAVQGFFCLYIAPYYALSSDCLRC